MGVFIKICGITSLDMALDTVASGVDAIGLVFANSRRRIDLRSARAICLRTENSVARVGVFVNEELHNVLETAAFTGISHVQLHGDESPAYCEVLRGKGLGVIKAFRVKTKSDLLEIANYEVDSILLDSYAPSIRGGSGIRLNLNLIQDLGAARTPFIVAGGLSPANVGEVIKNIRPFGVDVSSGVERDGQKSIDLIHEFVMATREAEAAM